MLVTLIAALVTASNVKKNGSLLGVLCLFFGVVCLLWLLREHKKSEKKLWHSVRDMDWATALFIIAVFIIVQSLTSTGLVRDIASFIGTISGTSLLGTFLLIVSLSVMLSAFIDNVPYMVAMLPVTQIVAENLSVSPYVYYFGLLVGVSVGGNITPIGASANIVGVGLLKNRGYHTTFWEFVNIGLPFTLASVFVSCAFLWIVHGL